MEINETKTSSGIQGSKLEAPHDAYLARRISDVAFRHYDANRSRFLSAEHFGECVASCYYLVAVRYCRKWNDRFGKAAMPLCAQMGDCIFSLPKCAIECHAFASAVGRYYAEDGKQHRPPYGACLDALVAEGVVHRCDAYSNARAKSFTKSYGLHNRFVLEAMRHYFSAGELNHPFDIHAALCGRCPPTLAKTYVRKAKKTYESLGVINGIRLVLPKGWDKIDDDGHLPCGIRIDVLVRDMDEFKSQRDYGYRYGRHYNWFTMCSSAFRKYLYVGDKHFRELVDCPSGVIWMLAIAGCEEHKIRYDEVSGITLHCLLRSFYSDLSGEAKTPELKKKFMRILNSSSAQFEHLVKDPSVGQIVANISMHYPGFWKYVQTLRMTSKEMGRIVHEKTTAIERTIMGQIAELLKANGYTHLFRVHDALWGIDDIPDIAHYLWGIVFRHLVDLYDVEEAYKVLMDSLNGYGLSA